MPTIRRAFHPTRLAMLAGVACVWAGQAGAQGATTVEDLIVTAEKREQSTREVPSTMSAFSAADIETRRLESVADVVRQVPNVSFGEIGFGTQLSSRGIGTSLITGLGESSVALHVDGIYLSRPNMASMIQKDLARVEFLRGPQGTLYGRNATGGVLNLITPSPTATPQGGLKAGVGTYRAFQTEGDVSGPLNDRVRGRLWVSSETHDGYTKHLNDRQELDALRNYGARISLDADLTEATSLQLRFFYQKEHSTGPVFKPIQTGLPIPADVYSLDPWTAAPNISANRDREMVFGSARFDIEAGDMGPLGQVRFTSITGAIKYATEVHSIDADGTALNLFSNRVPENDKQLTQEFNLVGSGTPVSWTVGAFYIYEHVRADRYTDTPGFAGIGLRGIVSLTNMKAHSYSVFGDATLKASDRLEFFGGLRGTWEQRRQFLTNKQILVSGAEVIRCAPSGPLGNLEREDDALTGRVGAKYRAGETNFYAQASRGYKSGGMGYSTCGNTFEPEKLDAIEVGAKSFFFDRRMRLDVAAFHYDLKNLQVEQIQTVGSVISSVPKSRIYGVEAEGEWRITPRLTVNFAGGLLNAEYVRFFDTDSLNVPAGPQNLSGKKLNRSPKWSASYGVQYEQPLSWGTLLLRADFRSTDKFTLRPANLPLDFQAGYTTVDLSAALTSPSGAYRVRGWVRNATKEAYLQGLFSTVLVQRVGTFGPPRTAGLELSARF